MATNNSVTAEQQTEAQWQDHTTLRIRALETKIKFYRKGRTSLDRIHLGMAKGELLDLSASLLRSFANSDTPAAFAWAQSQVRS